MVTLQQTRMWGGGTVDDGFVVSKEGQGTNKWNTKVTEHEKKIDGLLRSSLGRYIFTAISSCVTHILKIGVPIHGCLVE